jgi:hypothetical protein
VREGRATWASSARGAAGANPGERRWWLGRLRQLGWRGAQRRGRAGAGRSDGAERVAPGGGAADGVGVRLGARVGGGAE